MAARGTPTSDACGAATPRGPCRRPERRRVRRRRDDGIRRPSVSQRHAGRRVLVRGTPGRVPRTWRPRDDHAHPHPERGRRARRGLGRRRWPRPGCERRGRLDPGRRRVDARHGAVPLRGDHARGSRLTSSSSSTRASRSGSDTRVAVLELAGRPGWWRIWVDGQPVTRPVRMRGSSGRWAPIATAESWNAGTPACNAFGFRFERVSVSYGGGGSWRPFVSGHRFLDGTHTLRDLAAAPAESGVYRNARERERPAVRVRRRLVA